MTQKVSELLSSALRLSPSERQDLADSLWASLDQDDPYAGMTEDEFIAELDLRSAELQADPTAGMPWDEVRNLK
jgi:putative addiction module component (TIGR02574 family)